MPKISHLSYSSISTYLRCPRSWRFRYLDKVQTPKAAALVFGSAFHDCIGHLLLGTMKAENAWESQWKSQLEKSGEVKWGNDNEVDLFALGLRMLTEPLVVTGLGPERKQTATEALADLAVMKVKGVHQVERRVKMTVPGSLVPVIGYIDAIDQDGIPCDFKTASKAWYANKAHSELQPSFYLAALMQTGQLSPGAWKGDAARFRYYIFTKAKTPKLQIIETSRRASDLMWIYVIVEEVFAAISAGVFPPTDPANWICGERWCDYWAICRGGHG